MLKLNQAWEKEAVELLRKGVGVATVAKRLGISKYYVETLIEKHDLRVDDQEERQRIAACAEHLADLAAVYERLDQ